MTKTNKRRNKLRKGGTKRHNKKGYFSSIRNVFGGKKERKSVKLQKLNCSPKEKGKINDFSCYTNESLMKLKELWNARHPDVKITTNSPKEIHRFISEKLSGVCNKESCWLKQKADFGKVDSDIADSFAPESPPNGRKILTNGYLVLIL